MSKNTLKKYTGKIFKVLFQLPGDKAQTFQYALALSEPDEYGEIEFAFVKDTNESPERCLELPLGTLPNYSFVYIDRRYHLPESVILEQVGNVDPEFLKTALKSVVFLETKRYYNTVHKRENEEFIPGKSRINYAGRIFDEREMTNLVDSALDFWLTAGKYAEEFEERFAEFLGVKYCSLCNSGSSANLLAFMALTSLKLGERRIKKGDEVITVAAGFPTTITPIVQSGAIPVFVDITLPTYNINCAQLENALSEKTKAVMVAHTLGNPFDVAKVKEFCEKHNLWLIEDNCDALGSRYFYNGEWHYTGTFGDIATSSFYPPHHITMGEGGAVYTNNLELHRIINSFRDWGRDCWCTSGHDNTCKKRFQWQLGELPYGYDHKYIYSHFGYNLKVTDMQAAIGCAQLEKLPVFIAARKKNWQLLRDGLSHLEEKFILPQPTPNSDPSWFGFLLTVREDAGFTRNEIVQYLEQNGIQTRMLFAGNLIKHPCFNAMRENGGGFRMIGKLSNTDRIIHDTFWIGVYPGMREEMIKYMIEKINKFVRMR
uniref:Lipopolysaccharide biosynthesis protein RfbH n=1 Tax=candidate division WOR-3 bacterium TaxID=2052148 RepID=A0A7V3VU24_UNCW3